MTPKQQAKKFVRNYGKEIAKKIVFEITWVSDLSEKSYNHFLEVKKELDNI